MIINTSENYICHHDWLRDNIAGRKMILRGVSALEYTGMFVGYMREKEISVYTLEEITVDNLDTRTISCFEDVDFLSDNEVMYTSFTQTVNDMLSEFEITDEVALVEALAKYYEKHGNFDSLEILPENEGVFSQIMDWAMTYYEED